MELLDHVLERVAGVDCRLSMTGVGGEVVDDGGGGRGRRCERREVSERPKTGFCEFSLISRGGDISFAAFGLRFCGTFHAHVE